MILAPEEMEESHPGKNVADFKRTTAWAFAISQSLVFFTIDGIIWSNIGYKRSMARYRSNGKWAKGVLAGTAANLFLQMLTLSLSMIRDMTLLSVLGCFLVFLQLFIRVFFYLYFPASLEHEVRRIEFDGSTGV